MSLLIKTPLASTTLLVKGANKLSHLRIDADKDWQGKGISNLRELAQGMKRGDLLYRRAEGLVKLSPGPISYELTSRGAGSPVEWSPPPSI